MNHGVQPVPAVAQRHRAQNLQAQRRRLVVLARRQWLRYLHGLQLHKSVHIINTRRSFVLVDNLEP